MCWIEILVYGVKNIFFFDIDSSKKNGQYHNNRLVKYILLLRIIPIFIYFFISGPPVAYTYDSLMEIIISLYA